MPNQIFFDQGGNNNLNPSFINSSETLLLQVQVLDIAGQAIPNQNIRWYIQNGTGIQDQLSDVSLRIMILITCLGLFKTKGIFKERILK